MSASLVGSEMCIRDRLHPVLRAEAPIHVNAHVHPRAALGVTERPVVASPHLRIVNTWPPAGRAPTT
eukprot:14756093-Alexandrium_andersonii.AAC.1